MAPAVRATSKPRMCSRTQTPIPLFWRFGVLAFWRFGVLAFWRLVPPLAVRPSRRWRWAALGGDHEARRDWTPKAETVATELVTQKNFLGRRSVETQCSAGCDARAPPSVSRSASIAPREIGHAHGHVAALVTSLTCEGLRESSASGALFRRRNGTSCTKYQFARVRPSSPKWYFVHEATFLVGKGLRAPLHAGRPREKR